jgi:hypothetical protein
MRLDSNTVAAMAAARVQFVVNIRVPGGGHDIGIEAADVQSFVDDPEAFAAKYFGVGKNEYLSWVEADGAPRCGATTAKGTRCKNLVSGGIQQSIEKWLKLDGGYCAVHGGDSAEVARGG